jgi:hypothetical protein
VNQWSFVVAAYALVVVGTLALVVTSWVAMRRAEAASDAVRQR